MEAFLLVIGFLSMAFHFLIFAAVIGFFLWVFFEFFGFIMKMVGYGTLAILGFIFISVLLLS